MLAVILARGGSKGVPDKNIKMLGNKCLSHYALDALMKASLECQIVYSSDNPLYLSLAEAFVSAEHSDKSQNLVLHTRSFEMSHDHVSSWDAVTEIVTEFEIENGEPVLLVSGVCPALTAMDIVSFVNKMSNSNSGLTIRPNDYPVESTFCITEEGFVEPHALSGKIAARQHAKAIYRPDGHLYWRLTGDIKNDKVFPNANTQVLNLNKQHYINIDTLKDFEYAEYVMSELYD